MAKLTDELSERDWTEARSWVEKLNKDPFNDALLADFEDWLGEVPARAGAYRKTIDTLKLLPYLKRHIDSGDEDHCPNTTQKPKAQD